MKWLFCFAPLFLGLLVSGCSNSGARKAQIESELPAQVTQTLREKSVQSPANANVTCVSVGLTQSSPNTYVGEAVFQDGSKTKITVTDDSNSYYFETEPFTPSATAAP